MAQSVRGSNFIINPIYYSHANRGSDESQAREGFSLSEGEISVPNPSEMIDFTKYLKNIQVFNHEHIGGSSRFIQLLGVPGKSSVWESALKT